MFEALIILIALISYMEFLIHLEVSFYLFIHSKRFFVSFFIIYLLVNLALTFRPVASCFFLNQAFFFLLRIEDFAVSMVSKRDLVKSCECSDISNLCALEDGINACVCVWAKYTNRGQKLENTRGNEDFLQNEDIEMCPRFV